MNNCIPPRETGIYAIINIEAQKFYIGSAVSLYKRFFEHRRTLRRGTHRNSLLQRAWNKYGENRFQFVVLEIISRDEVVDYQYLLDVEQCWMDAFQVCDRSKGYNLHPTAGSGAGAKFSEESRNKIRLARLGKPAYNKGKPGRPWTPEQKAKVQAKLKGVPKPSVAEKLRGRKRPEHARLMSERMKGNQYFLGRKHSDGAKEKVRQAKLGKPRPDVAKQFQKTFVLTTPDDIEILVTNLSQYCLGKDIKASGLSSVAANLQKTHRGYKCRHATNLEIDTWDGEKWEPQIEAS